MSTFDPFATALQLAKQRKGYTSPNPAVGAVVIKQGQILGRGHHVAAGQAHAEVVALAQAGEQARGADLYITLEPCCHTGKTPPCTEAIIRAGIARVFYAEPDPNPVVRGKSELVLQQAGIECLQQNQPEIHEFYRTYRYFWKHKRPWVTAKLAVSLDGKSAGKQGERVQLTGADAQRWTHQQRANSDAIITTSHTVARDNPQLNVRLGDQAVKKPVFILARDADVDPHCRLTKTSAPLTVIHGPQAPKEQLYALRSADVNCVELPTDAEGILLAPFLDYLGTQGFHEVWVEAGGRLFQQLLTHQLLAAAYFFVAPKTLGTGATSAFSQPFDFTQLSKTVQWKILGQDSLCYCQFVEG